MRLCARCRTTPTDHYEKYCSPCRFEVNEEQRIRGIERTIANRKKRRLARAQNPQEPPEPRKCRTENCENMVTGRNKFCPACKLVRRRAHQPKHKNETKIEKDPLEIAPQTNLEWLKPFVAINAEARKHGASYGQYVAPKVTITKGA